MEDELQKRNTDCVYFLASPLTCKKGMECEYRHSEIARLNPRDCWYWLAGNCLNPTCAFRHPPLDGRPETSSDPAPLPHQASVPVSKTSVPCYFYFNGFCNKGDSCSFLHGPNGVTPAQSSKTALTVTSAHSVENKTLAKVDRVPPSIEPAHDQSETTTKAVENIQSHCSVDFQPSSSKNILQQSPSPRISLPECNEAIVKSEILLPVEDLRSPLCEDQSSDDHVDGHIEPEERWESSPGFDVLVDDGSENLGYEDDPEYLLAHKREARVLHEHLLQYDYEDSVGYDPLEYPDSRILYEHGMYESYDHLENDHISDHISRIPNHSREMMLDPAVLPKRKHFPREVDRSDRNGVDLRNHLRKRRRITSHPKRSGLSHLNDRNRERPGRRRRLASEVNVIGAQSENDTRSNDSHRRGWSRRLEPRNNRPKSKQQDRERQRQARPKFMSSEISRGDTASRDAGPTQESITFTGPKTLAQIKEEKRKAREDGDNFGSTIRNGRTTPQNFEGPKPLSEILKDKRRLGSMSDDNTRGRSKHDRYEDEFLDEYEDDDGLERKLASILS